MWPNKLSHDDNPSFQVHINPVQGKRAEAQLQIVRRRNLFGLGWARYLILGWFNVIMRVGFVV
jgi:hypothetical protein